MCPKVRQKLTSVREPHTTPVAATVAEAQLRRETEDRTLGAITVHSMARQVKAALQRVHA